MISVIDLQGIILAKTLPREVAEEIFILTSCPSSILLFSVIKHFKGFLSSHFSHKSRDEDHYVREMEDAVHHLEAIVLLCTTIQLNFLLCNWSEAPI